MAPLRAGHGRFSPEEATKVQRKIAGRGVAQARLHHGWYVVGACFMAMFVHSGIGFYAFGVFFTPIEDEFGWNRATIAAAMSIGALIAGLASPIVGQWTQSFGSRKMMIGGAVIMGTGLMALYGMSNLWQLYAFFIVATVGRAGLSSIPIGTVLGNWFRQRRGLAMGIAATGIGVGGGIMAPIASYLISVIGWRAAIAALGLTTVAIVIPLVLAWVRHTPQEMGLQPYGEATNGASDGHITTGSPSQAADQSSLTYKQALGTSAFWMISGALFLIALGQASVLLHIVPFLEDRGIGRESAAAILAITSVMGGVGKFSMGYASDKFPARLVLTFCFVLQAIGLAMITLPVNPVSLPAFVVLYGIGMGGVFALQPVIAAETFGIGSLGTILGSLIMPSAVSQGIGPILAGYIFDTTGSYALAFTLFIAMALVAAAMIFPARPVVGLGRKVEAGKD